MKILQRYLIWVQTISMSLLCVISFNVVAQEIEKINHDIESIKLNDELEDQLKSLISENTGIDAGFLGSTSATKDFLSDYAISTLLSSGDEKENGLIEFDLNFLLLRNKAEDIDHDSNLKLSINTDAKLADDIKTSLSGGDKATNEMFLSGEIDAFDDLKLSYSYNLQNERMGRSFKVHRPKLFNLISSIYSSDGSGEGENEPNFSQLRIDALARYHRFEFELAKMFPEIIDEDFRFTDDTIKLLLSKNDTREVGLLAQRGLKQLQEEYDASVGEFFRKYQIRRFSDLVNNQPQLHFSLEKTFRNSLIGPDTISAKLTWEKGFANLNQFYADTTNQTPAMFAKYISDNESRIDASNRVAFSLEYQVIDSETVTNSDIGLALSRKQNEKLIGSLIYGRNIGKVVEGEPNNRIDLSISYEKEVTGDDKDSRFVASATLTRKVGKTSFPVTLVYANKSELLEDTNSQISAHLGIKYDFGGLLPGL